MIGLLLGKARLWLIGLAAAIAALIAAYTRGSKDARDKGALAAAEAYRNTRKDLDDVEMGNDPDAARRWLHERGQ